MSFNIKTFFVDYIGMGVVCSFIGNNEPQLFDVCFIKDDYVCLKLKGGALKVNYPFTSILSFRPELV